MALNVARFLRFAGGGNSYIFPDFQEDIYYNFGELVTRTTRIPNVSGGFNERGSDPLDSEIGSVTFGFYLFTRNANGMTSLRDGIKRIEDWGEQRLYIQPSDPALGERWCNAVVSTVRMQEKPSSGINHHKQLVTMNFHVPDPFWYEIGTESWSWGDGTLWGDKDWGGSVTPQACSGLQTDFTVAVDGSVRTSPRITIQCGAGQTASNPEIQRLKDGVVVDRVKIPETLVAGDSYEINCRALSFKKNGVDAYNSLVELSHYKIMELPIGTQSIRVKFDNPSDAADVTMRWFTKWR